MSQPLSSQQAAWMTARIFLPSKASLAISSIIAVVAVAVHVLVIAIRQGAILPDFLDGQWTEAYNSAFGQPVTDFLAHTTLNNLLEVVLWSIIGLVVYSLAEKFFKNYFEWRDAERSVQLIAPGNVVRHPLERPFYSILAWRIICGILFTIWIIVAFTMARSLFNVEGLAFTDARTDIFNEYLVLLAVQWLFLSFSFVVLLRLSLRRTRLMGARQIHTGTSSGFFQD